MTFQQLLNDFGFTSFGDLFIFMATQMIPMIIVVICVSFSIPFIVDLIKGIFKKNI